MRMARRTGQAGFNLIETIMASMILSGAVLTLGAISTNAVTGTRLNRQHELAAMLLDRQLALIDFLGIDQFIETDQTEGTFEDFEGFMWQATTEYQGVDNLYLVTVTVHWFEGKRPYSVTAQTMLNGAGLQATTEAAEP